MLNGPCKETTGLSLLRSATSTDSRPAESSRRSPGTGRAHGGWAQVHGATMSTTTTLNLSIDEDTIGDAERNHTTEQVGYVVFAGPGSAQ